MLLTHLKTASAARSMIEASNINSEFARIVAANEAAMFQEDSAHAENDSANSNGKKPQDADRS